VRNNIPVRIEIAKHKLQKPAARQNTRCTLRESLFSVVMPRPFHSMLRA
jgi:hypothetical protein